MTRRIWVPVGRHQECLGSDELLTSLPATRMEYGQYDDFNVYLRIRI